MGELIAEPILQLRRSVGSRRSTAGRARIVLSSRLPLAVAIEHVPADARRGARAFSVDGIARTDHRAALAVLDPPRG